MESFAWAEVESPTLFKQADFDPSWADDPTLSDLALNLDAPQGFDDVDMGAEGWWAIPAAPCSECAAGGITCQVLKGSDSCTSCLCFGRACDVVAAKGDLSGLGGLERLEGGLEGLQGGLEGLQGELQGLQGELVNGLEGIVEETRDMEEAHDPEAEHSETSHVQGYDTDSHVQDTHDAQDTQEGQDGQDAAKNTRFSRTSVRILREWIVSHKRHPYPTGEEKSVLMRQTGLSKTQISNWMANARRRGLVPPPRADSPVYTTKTLHGLSVPVRRSTPALEAMNPLQRWANSPPENEPASVMDIARAVTASNSQGLAGFNSPYLSSSYMDDGSGRSLLDGSGQSLFNGSSASSGLTGTSRSSGSSYSMVSSMRSGMSQFSGRHRQEKSRRRRRKNTHRRAGEAASSGDSLAPEARTFQCTFCTDTFRTKHDWQRHEKSLHLSLERWACALEGPRCDKDGVQCCAFCGDPNPDADHIERHNYSACLEKTVAERTFFRKDHLSQHLRLVHNVKYADWSMAGWRMAAPPIVSRCGFCSDRLESWAQRVDHLAEHFKSGKTMEHWTGDWGFEPSVLHMVENAIPPYRIHHERVSPYPYVAGQSPESPRSAWDLIKLEMDFFRTNYVEQHQRDPSDDECQIEACRIIFASESLSLRGIASELSWFRDLLMGNPGLAREARFARLRDAAESRLSILKINGKDNLFERCMLEKQLLDWVEGKIMLGLTPLDEELRHEACAIVGRIEEMSTAPSEPFANWIIRLVLGSASQWLSLFRQRAHLPRSEDVGDQYMRSSDPSTIDSTVHSYSRLERELADYLETQRRVARVEPSDKDLQRQACVIIYEFADEWNQTAADNREWLAGFRARHPPSTTKPPESVDDVMVIDSGADSFATNTVATNNTMTANTSAATNTAMMTHTSPTANTSMTTATTTGSIYSNPLFLNAGPCDRLLARDLRRWALATMSPKNPTSHIPTDAELQYQARWVLYNNDDGWNMTPADNAEWLRQFKIAVGILPPDTTSNTNTPPSATTTTPSPVANISPQHSDDLFSRNGLYRSAVMTQKGDGFGYIPSEVRDEDMLFPLEYWGV